MIRRAISLNAAVRPVSFQVMPLALATYLMANTEVRVQQRIKDALYVLGFGYARRRILSLSLSEMKL